LTIVVVMMVSGKFPLVKMLMDFDVDVDDIDGRIDDC